MRALRVTVAFAVAAGAVFTGSASSAAGVGASAPSAATASASTTYPRPAGTSFTLSGRGYGHGRGMSQYGAYGAALKGLSRNEMLSFYYPGTTRSTSIGNPTMRVRLTALGSTTTQLVTTPGLVVSDGTKTGALAVRNSDGTPRVRWRLVPEGTGLTLQWLEKGSWRSTSSWRARTVPLSFTDASLGAVRVVLPDGSQRDYRRTVRGIRWGAGMMTLSVVSMDYYLQSVVPSEMPASWPTAALEAQVVAARTYAAHQRANQAPGTPYDTCDSTSCQVYRGLAGYTTGGTQIPHENARSTAAVASTAGLGLFANGSPALTEFGSSNGGRTVKTALPYQVSLADPYDAVPSASTSRWTKTLPISAIEKAYPTIGKLKALRIDKRDGIDAWGGRIITMTVIGSAGSKTVKGTAFSAALGLRSTWWTVS